ncbi:MAG: hypothetical protein A2599_02860 [Candidatus Staskawiczbacteria bacterium RIFOXYD1_FULL_39_28]|uniref:Uncharacterized protein n=1 Tax=Candidatus Staskawiczbacteria bacterium RIFOXYC1_FULL_38_18 TaxID=1802229 RepID=A0A1G2JC93_9BACT|nr:MAG: hypothetical protein A2401_01145 [Candidatus Staskawiczbacteria bacterium RIFOXYC1_FULL_38_18]OGZ92318.1 MAG: hypothetical protein A2599_02860 [Candidatus Staskawiczbacteria bacterium RIFOXYD1_FULL_39_28]
MNSLSKNFIIIFLIICVVGIFGFHWFLISDMMPIGECFSVDCVYTPAQTIPQGTQNILLIALMAILFGVATPLAILSDKKLTELPRRMFLEWRIGGFCRKLILWLKILEKRDPQTALIAARISNFSQ